MNTPTYSPEMTGIMMMPTTSPRLTRQNAMCIDEPFELPLSLFLDYNGSGKNPEKECLRALLSLRKKIQNDLSVADSKALEMLKKKIEKIDELVDCLLSE